MVSAAKAYKMLGNESLWMVAQRCSELFNRAGIPYGVCGGVAVCLHGYQRNTVDVDMIIRPEDSDRVRQLLQENGFTWNPETVEFTTDDGFVVQFLVAGSNAGKDSEVKVVLPEGDLNVDEMEGMSVVRLSRLIEMKIACGMNNLRRTHKDFADVVELIAIRNLDSSFARYLHKTVRPTFRRLVRNANADGK
ncbi:MAG: hypothetical protein KDA87_26170 [Planctomycetales bacterium]|nr:hypothetical protein [Planctomycetales bacterium]